MANAKKSVTTKPTTAVQVAPAVVEPVVPQKKKFKVSLEGFTFSSFEDDDGVETLTKPENGGRCHIRNEYVVEAYSEAEAQGLFMRAMSIRSSTRDYTITEEDDA